MTFALIAHRKDPASSGACTTTAIDTSGANLIVVTTGYNGAVTSSALSDSKGNTWTFLTAYTSTWGVGVWYCLSPTVGSGHTFSIAAGFPSICVTAWSGAAASSVLDQQTGTAYTSQTSQATGSLTPANANSLVIASWAGGDGATGPLTINGGFTISDQQLGPAGVSESSGQAYLIQTSIAAANPTWASFSSTSGGVILASFNAAASGASTPWQSLVQDNQPFPDLRRAVAV